MRRQRPEKPRLLSQLGRYWYWGVIGLAVLALGGWWWFRQEASAGVVLDPAASATVPGAVQTSSASGGSGGHSAGVSQSASTSRPAAPAKNGQVWVDIQGAVQKPGVYQLAADSRLDHAVRAAGGLRPEADRRQVNLAQPLTDGAAIYIPKAGEQAASSNAPAGESGVQPGPAASGSSAPAADTGEAAININSATQADLEQVSGIGPKRAGDIIAYRESHGPFQSLDELGEISGIGEKTLATLKAALTL
ncbi:helix-hairpin-helix domain-containing protein [Schleiferilactobacillus shenzhenensis]|nr:helix-hairpin-helix domain-containing protein [Schleiferilactobacillus shenzhenensis]